MHQINRTRFRFVTCLAISCMAECCAASTDSKEPYRLFVSDGTTNVLNRLNVPLIGTTLPSADGATATAANDALFSPTLSDTPTETLAPSSSPIMLETLWPSAINLSTNPSVGSETSSPATAPIFAANPTTMPHPMITSAPLSSPVVESSSAPTAISTEIPTSDATITSPGMVLDTYSPSTLVTEIPTLSEGATLAPTLTDTTASPTLSDESESVEFYYPDWLGSNTGCIRDGNAPNYMTANPLHYMYSDLGTCCITHYNWNYNSCMGLQSETGKWYMKYSSQKCVKDCEGGSECGGFAESWFDLFDSQSICCQKKMWWDIPGCSESPAATDAGPTLPPSKATNLFYPDWHGANTGCVNDGNAPNYMTANPLHYMYSDLGTCCITHYNWNYKSCMGLRSLKSNKGKWYVKRSGKCVKDCVGKYPCGGLANKKNQLYDSKAACRQMKKCQKKKFKDDPKCTEARISFDIPSPAVTETKSPSSPPTTKRTRKPGRRPVKPPTPQPTSRPTVSMTTLSPVISDAISLDVTTLRPTFISLDVVTPNPTLPTTTQTASPPTLPDLSGLYYPDWSGLNTGCVKDGNPPAQMASNPSYYLSPDLGSCCTKYYGWNYNFCMGLKPNTGKWYMNYSLDRCVKDCEGGGECGGFISGDWEYLYESKLSCCREKKWWDIFNC